MKKNQIRNNLKQFKRGAVLKLVTTGNNFFFTPIVVSDCLVIGI